VSSANCQLQFPLQQPQQAAANRSKPQQTTRVTADRNTQPLGKRRLKTFQFNWSFFDAQQK